MDISFEQFYGDNKYQSLDLFLIWTDDFLKGIELPAHFIDDDVAFQFVSQLRMDDFPAEGGFEKASPFKKAANIFVYLHAINPFLRSTEPVPSRFKDLEKFEHAYATIVGYSIVKTCLLGISLRRRDDSVVKLKNPISISKHFLIDLIESCRGITPDQHFKVYSLLFESLAYQANPDASYSRVF